MNHQFLAELSRPETIELLAQQAHESNRAYCALIGDSSQLPWEQAPEWQRESARLGVQGVIEGNGPGASHEGWMQQKYAEGWVYGETKDEAAKTHPCLVPFSALPLEQQVKDFLFVDTVRMMLNALLVARGGASLPPSAAPLLAGRVA